jgi:tRNA nucleotidyltransferase/poly(A) polymerase
MERSMRSLLFLSGLYHDTGKPLTRQIDESARVRFFEHEMVSSTLATERARQLRLSNDEIERLAAIVRNHMRPLLLAQAGAHPTRRAIYRYFRSTKAAGIDIGLLSLADCMATYGSSLPFEPWVQLVAVIRDLYESWWEHPEQAVQPPALVNGTDLMEFLMLEPGPKIGQILETIREAQAAGQVETREQALNLAKKSIEARSEG